MNKSNARLPNPGEYVRMTGLLVEVQDVTPKEVVLDYIFEDTSARVEGRINGKLVKEFGTYSNFRGRDTCVESAICDAKKEIDRLGESNLEFVVVKITSRCRMRPSPGRENFYDREFVHMQRLDFGCRWDLPEETEEFVWSSFNDNTEPEA